MPTIGRTGEDRRRAAWLRHRHCRQPGARPTNVAWQAPLQGAGVSSPIVFGNCVFVTSQAGDGRRRAGNHPTLTQGGDPSDGGGSRRCRAAFTRRCAVRRRSVRSRDGEAARGFTRRRPRASCRRCTTSTTSRARARHRRRAGLRVVRHRADRGARYQRQAGVVEASRQGLRRIRHQLGPRQFAGAVPGLDHPALLSLAGLVHAWRSTSARAR